MTESPTGGVRGLAALFAEKIQQQGAKLPPLPPNQASQLARKVVNSSPVARIVQDVATQRQQSPAKQPTLQPPVQTHPATEKPVTEDRTPPVSMPEWRRKQLEGQQRDKEARQKREEEERRAKQAYLEEERAKRRGGTDVTATGVPDVSAIRILYRTDDRGPRNLAVNYRGFTARQLQDAQSVQGLLQEMCAKGVDSWMAEWVGGSMMGTKPCVSTSSQDSAFGTAKRFLYRLQFPGGVKRLNWTEEVLGFSPPTEVGAARSILFGSDATIAGSAIVGIAYASEVLFLTEIPGDWISHARRWTSDEWKPVSFESLKATTNKLTEDLDAW